MFFDHRACSPEIRLFDNQFTHAIETLPVELQFKLIELQCNEMLKEKFREGNLVEFHTCLSLKQFLHMIKFACKYTSMFGTTGLCEKTFSTMKYTKACYQIKLSNVHLNSILKLGITHLQQPVVCNYVRNNTISFISW